MLKLKVKNNGEELANKLHQTANMLLELVQGMAPEVEELLKGLKVYAKHGKGYVYLIVEVDNPLADGIISFAAQVLTLLWRFSSPSPPNAPSNLRPKFPQI